MCHCETAFYTHNQNQNLSIREIFTQTCNFYDGFYGVTIDLFHLRVFSTVFRRELVFFQFNSVLHFHSLLFHFSSAWKTTHNEPIQAVTDALVYLFVCACVRASVNEWLMFLCFLNISIYDNIYHHTYLVVTFTLCHYSFGHFSRCLAFRCMPICHLVAVFIRNQLGFDKIVFKASILTLSVALKPKVSSLSHKTRQVLNGFR